MNIIHNLIERYLLYLKINKNYSENTINAYQKDIIQFYNYLNKDNLEVSNRELEQYLIYLKKYKSNTMCRKISSLKSFYNFLLRNNEIKSNYFKNIKKTEIIPKYLSIQEINDFLNNMEYNKYYLRDKAMFKLIYVTGIRVSELINLTINDLYITKGLLKVNGKGKKKE